MTPKSPADGMRAFDDMESTRSWLNENVVSSLSERFPIENDDLRLELTDVRLGGNLNPGLAKQKKALLRNDKLRIPVKGKWRLTDRKSGEVLDERDGTVMNIPYLSDRNTIIYKGNEYSTASQQRLKPGVYSRRKASGEYESFVNPEPGSGRTFRVWMEPKTGVFKVNVGTANIPLYPLLRSMGQTDADIDQAFGKDIAEVNRSKRDPNAYKKLYERFVRRTKDIPEPLSDEERMQAIAEAVQAIKLRKEVVSRNLGVESDHVSPEVLTAAAERLIRISKGEDQEDDRDEPMFTTIHGIEDLVPERIDKDAGRLAQSLLYRVGRDKTLKRMPTSALDPYADGYFFGSRLVQPLEETNPLALLEQMNRVTKMGEGGIGDVDAITMSAHNVKPGQAGFIDPILGPEGLAIGVDTRAAYHSYKGRDQKLYGEFLNKKTGKKQFLTPEDTDRLVVGLPGEDKRKDGMAIVIKGGQMVEVPQEEIDVTVPSFAHLHAPHINLNPMPTAVQTGRQFYGGKFWSQYMPMVEGEAPLVGSLTPDGSESFDQYYGKKVGTLKSPVSGTVARVMKDKVIIEGDDGSRQEVDVVQNFPFNRFTQISYRPAVKAGDHVERGGVVARSNVVDDDNALRLGRNLSVAVLAHRGNSYEDAVVISESAAKKMATDRLYSHSEETRHGVKLGRDRYKSLFPKEFSKDQINMLDEDGIVKPGTELTYGDPILLATGPKLLSPEDLQLGRLHKTLRGAHTDKAQRWEHHYPGKVVDAVKTRNGANVNIQAQVPMQTGDKLSPRAGLKGTIGIIVPDDEMPRNAATNKPFEVLLNPMTILSRVAGNAGVEMQLGKLARKQGKRILLPQEPPEEGWQKWATKQLAEAGVPSREDVFDPGLGRNLPQPVGTGYMYFSPFHHLSEKKMSARSSIGSAYDANEQPAKGGEELQQSKRLSGMDTFQLLAHGADEVLKDAMLIRGQKNDNLWKAFRNGQPLPEPEVPFIYDKFINTLKAGGINVVDKGTITALQPMTDEAMIALSQGEIKSGAMYTDAMKPIPGGLFDPGATGGPGGSRWSHITLAEPMPNPVFEEPIRRLLGLRQKDLADVIAGRMELGGATGGTAIKNALAALDVGTEKQKALIDVKAKRGSARDDAVKRLGYLAALEKQGISPDKWVISRLPVLPPKFRPVSKMGDVLLSADLNELYRDAIEVNNSFKELVPEVGRENATEEAELLYDAVKAATGLGSAITPEGRARKLKGAIHSIKGDSPKRGMFQSRLLSKTMDLVGRGVVTPDPNLDMDTIGMPEEMAWKLYKDFAVRNLVRNNTPNHVAVQMVADRHPLARKVIQEEMERRPVIMDRAPTWHKFNFSAFKPVMVPGDSVVVSPLVTKSYTMDFDGDFQVAKVLIFVENDTLTKILGEGSDKNNTLTILDASAHCIDMYKQKTIPTEISGCVCAVDLEDFPHGEFSNRVEGQNGPIDFYHALPGTRVFAMNPGGGMQWTQVSYWSKHYSREVEIVNLYGGKQIITDDDPRAVFGMDPHSGTLELVRDTPSNALERGLVVPVVRDTGTIFDNASLAEAVDITEEDVPFKRLPLSFDNGWMLGAMAGDGWWDRKDYNHAMHKGSGSPRVPHLADKTGHNAEKLLRVIRELSGCSTPFYFKLEAKKADSPDRYGDSVKHTFGFPRSELFTKFLDEHLGGERSETTAGSGNKHLPNFAYTAPRDFRIGMLCGLLDTDGTCAVSRANNREQLICAISSTSLRLLRDAKQLANTLGVRGTITATKTPAGKDHWLLTFSSGDCKREDLFGRLATDSKRAAFAATEVDTERRLYSGVVMPDHIHDALVQGFTIGTDRSSPEEKAHFAAYTALKRAKERGNLITRKALACVISEIERKRSELVEKIEHARNLLETVVSVSGVLQDEQRKLILAGMSAALPGDAPKDLKRQLLTESASMRRWVTKAVPAGEREKRTLDWFKSLPVPAYVLHLPEVQEYLALVEDPEVDWAPVEGVEKTGQFEDGYDLTVPGCETFTSVDGVVLSNTVNLHVPVSDKAVSQAWEKMRPSKNLFSLTDLVSARHTPQQEMVMGLYLLSRSAAGKSKQTRKFTDKDAVIKAYRRGEIGANDPVEIIS